MISAHGETDHLRLFLQGYGIQSLPTRITELPGGMDNQNLKLEFNGLHPLVLRVYHVTRPEELAFEAALIDRLYSRGFPTARLYRTQDGAAFSSLQDAQGALFAFLPGAVPDEEDEQAAAQAAALIAHLHMLTWGEPFAPERTRTDLNRLLALGDAARRYPGDAALQTMAEQAAAMRAQIDALTARRTLPWGAIHHDAHAGNLLIDRAGASLIDFDEAHMGYLVNDIAVLAVNWAAQPQGIDTARAARAIRAYNTLRPLTADEKACLCDFILMYVLADASEYVCRSLAAGTSPTPVEDCHSYARYRMLVADDTWRTALLPLIQ